jgi:hypothetical protein
VHLTGLRVDPVHLKDKWAPRQALLASLERALERDANERGSRARREQLELRFAALADREREVLGHVVHGRMKKQVRLRSAVMSAQSSCIAAQSPPSSGCTLLPSSPRSRARGAITVGQW